MLKATPIDNSNYTFDMIEVETGISYLGFIEIIPEKTIADSTQIVIKNPFFILSKAKEVEEAEE